MLLEQIIVLAILQGITEFLPISSSGHLAILSDLTGWKDQGIAMDVMMHVGSLYCRLSSISGAMSSILSMAVLISLRLALIR